jgi:hypothetical protein
VLGDVTGSGRWQLSGHRFCQQDSGLVAILASRPFLEGHVREAVLKLPNVTLVDGHDVCDLTATPDRRRVTGVRLARHNGATPARMLSADLVVDATGRGPRTPTWLRQLGYPAPPEDRVEIGVKYVSRVYRLRPDALGSDKGIVTAATPDHPRGGVLAALEGGRHLVSPFGMLGDHPPTDPTGFEDFAADLVFPDIAEAFALLTGRWRARMRSRAQAAVPDRDRLVLPCAPPFSDLAGPRSTGLRPASPPAAAAARSRLRTCPPSLP